MANSIRRSSPLLAASLLFHVSLPAFAAQAPLDLAGPESAAPHETAEVPKASSHAENLALQQQLEQLGVDPAEAEERLASLSAEERAALEKDLPQLRAGGDSTITIGIGTAIIIAILLIVFL